MEFGTAIENPPTSGSTSGWLTRRRVFIGLTAYFLLQTVIRVLVSDSAELDESHQLLCVQEWRWGYGSDPPLYTWLQRLVFLIVGPGILGLALLKNTLLFSAFSFTYLGAKELTRDERIALLATLSLFLFPQIAWESQRDLTHSVLAMTLGAATFYMAVKVWRSGSAALYALLGLCAGLGTLSKYSYCMFALALGAAALTIPTFRRALLSKRALISLAVFGLVVVFHLNWVFDSPELFWQRPAELIRRSDNRAIMGRVLGVASVAMCVVTLGGAISVLYLFIFRGLSIESKGEFREARLWIQRTLLGSAVVGLGVVLWLGIELKDRWFQPAIFLIAILAAILVRNRVTAAAERRFLLTVGAVAALVLTLLTGIPLAASITHRPTRLNAPFSVLSAQLKASAGEPGVIVANTRLVGGNLKLFFPGSIVVSPEFKAQCATDIAWLVVWDASKNPGPPPALVDLVAAMRGIDMRNLKAAFTEAFYKHTRAKVMKLGYAIMKPSLPGNTRASAVRVEGPQIPLVD